MHSCIIAIILITALAVTFSMPETAAAIAKKPAKVTGLRVTSSNQNAVNLKWSKAKNAKKYQIYRATKRGGKYKLLKTISGVKFKNTTVKTGRTYWYKVRAINGKRKGTFSKPVKGTTPLKKPKFKAQSSVKGPVLEAGKVSGATGYIFYRDGDQIAKQKMRTYVDKNADMNSPHTYNVRAYKMVDGKAVMSSYSRTLAASRIDARVKLSNCYLPASMMAGQAFNITGTISSNFTIKRVEIGIVDKSNNSWVSGAKYDNDDVDATTFDISKAKNSISFSAMYGGTYAYRIYVHLKDDSVVTVLNHTFLVGSGKGATAIVNMAKQCAWPYGTPKSKYKYNGGKRTAAYTAALQAAYGNRSGWGKQTKAGASCDVFVGTVVRASGYDTKFPRGLDGVVKHCKKYPNKWKKTGIKSVKKMLPGDVIYQEYKGGGGHIMIYLGNNRVANAHYMSKTYGIIEGTGVIQSSSSCNIYNVYRPIQ